MKACSISALKAHVILTLGMGGNYTSRDPGHWIVDERQANPLSVYPDGVNLRATGARETVGGILVKIETDAGIVGIPYFTASTRPALRSCPGRSIWIGNCA